METGDELPEAFASSKGTVFHPFPFGLLDSVCIVRYMPTFMVVVGLLICSLLLVLMGHLDSLAIFSAAPAGFLLAAAASLCSRHHYRSTQTPIQEKLFSFREMLLRRRVGPLCRSERGPARGIMAGQLWELLSCFLQYIEDRNMHYVCENLVKPLTKPEHVAYADLVGASQLQWFVSHYWGNAFKDFVESIRKHAESIVGENWEKMSYWVCTFSNSQWAVKAEVADSLHDSSFFLALRSESCRGTVMVVDEMALPLTRVWCLFEVATTCQRTNEGGTFEGLHLSTPSGVLNQGTAEMKTAIKLAQRLLHIDLRKAEASQRQDKLRIHRLVKSMDGGFRTVNSFVRVAIRNALFQMHAAFERDFEEIVSTLKTSSSKLSSMLSDISLQLVDEDSIEPGGDGLSQEDLQLLVANPIL